jgi:hypothetical protein
MVLLPEIFRLKITDVTVIFGTVPLIANLNSQTPALNGKGVRSKARKVGSDGILDRIDGRQDANQSRYTNRDDHDGQHRTEQIAANRLKSNADIFDNQRFYEHTLKL